MSKEVLSWNIYNAFSDPARNRELLDFIEDRSPDVAILQEAWEEGKEQALDFIEEDLGRSGYTIAKTHYEYKEGRDERQGFMAIVKSDLVTESPKVIRIATRNAFQIPVVDVSEHTGEEVEVNVFGIHLGDANEAGRFKQTIPLLEVANSHNHVIIGGDFNAMHRLDRLARALRIIRPFAMRLPEIDSRIEIESPKFTRFSSLASRLSDMADGDTMEIFKFAGFNDADPQHLATKGMVAIDHLMAKGMVADNFMVEPALGLSDHRPIRATFSVK